MKRSGKTLAILMCAIICTTHAHAATEKCKNSEYATQHPDECRPSTVKATLSIAGAAGIIGAGIAATSVLAGLNTNKGTAPRTSSAITPAGPAYDYDYVGDDIDFDNLWAITSTHQYQKNRLQYDDVRLGYAWARNLAGRGATIAILDTGDDDIHGRLVANIAEHIATGANITRHQVTSSAREFLSYDEIGAVISSAANAGIFNASWSVQTPASSVYSYDQLVDITGQNFIDAIRDAAMRDAIFVMAAGNDYGTQPGLLSALPRFIPQLHGHFINVVAWDSEKGRLADYSNACGITKEYCITAPGNHIWDSDGILSGTSAATPIVTAAVAIIQEQFPYMSADQITALLFTTARDLGAPGVDEIYGWGMLDMERATRPVGVELVPISENTTRTFDTARISGMVARNIMSADLQLAYLDSFGRAFTTPLNDKIKIQNPGRGFAQLRNYKNDNVVRFGNLSFSMAPNDFLVGTGILGTGRDEMFGFMGLGDEFDIGGVKLFWDARVGFGAPRTVTDSLISEFSNIYTASISAGVEYNGLRIAASMPDTILSGTMRMHMPMGRRASGEIYWGDYDIDLAGIGSVEYSVSYRFITAAFVDNPIGMDEFFIISHGRWRF